MVKLSLVLSPVVTWYPTGSSGDRGGCGEHSLRTGIPIVIDRDGHRRAVARMSELTDRLGVDVVGSG